MNHLFQIFKITKAEADKIAASPCDPHFHDFEELLVVTEGSLEHNVFKKKSGQTPTEFREEMRKIIA